MKPKKTKSLCPVCLEEIDANVIEKGGRVFIEKDCTRHGRFEALHFWDKPRLYNAMYNLFKKNEFNNPDGLVIDVTLNCDMECPFCFAQVDKKTMDEPNTEDILSRISGTKVSSVYLCGGEPTLREDLKEIISGIKKGGMSPIIFTNGIRLSDKSYAMELKEAGLDLVVLSFNSFDRDQNIRLHDNDISDKKIAALENTIDVGIPVYLYVIIKKGVNEDQIKQVVDFAIENNDYVRVINLQALWNLTEPYDPEIIGQTQIMEYLKSSFDLNEEDFIESTIFSHNFFEILRKITGKGGRRSPKCEIRCYNWVTNGKVVPLSKILNLKEMNDRLAGINSRLDESNGNRLIVLLKSFPYSLMAKEFIRSSNLRTFFIKKIPTILFDIIRNRPLSTSTTKGIVSIMLGRYHDRFNIDLDFVKTCTLYADHNDGRQDPFCIREINRSWNNNKIESTTLISNQSVKDSPLYTSSA